MSGGARRAVRVLVALGLLLGVSVLAGCASIPDSSPVEPLHKVTKDSGPAALPGPGDNATPLDLVLGFIKASSSPDNRHAAARLFLTPDSQDWDDTASVTVLANHVSSRFTRSEGEADEATVWLRGTQLGRLRPDGSFVEHQAAFDREYRVVRVSGQWRVTNPQPGVVMRFADVSAFYKPVALYFIGSSAQHNLVADLRNLMADPAQAMPSRVLDGLLGGPSDGLAGAAVSVIPRTARLRANLAPGPGGSLTVDLTGLGEPDEAHRKLIAEQVVLSLAQVSVTRVTLLQDGAPLLPDHPTLSPDNAAALGASGRPAPDVPGLVVIGGRAHTLLANELAGPLAGPAGTGSYDLMTATMSPDGQRLAAVGRMAGRQLLTGPAGGALVPSGVHAAALSRPTWTPDGSEVWTVADGTTVVRVVFDQTGHTAVAPVDAGALTRLGPVNDLRLSLDGARVASVIGGQLAVGAVIRSPNGSVRIGNVRVLRPAELTSLMSVAWMTDDEMAVAGRRSGVTVGTMSVDGLDLRPLPWNNLLPPLTSIAAAPGRPLLVTDQSGLWSFGMDDVSNWRQVAGGASAVADYPG